MDSGNLFCIHNYDNYALHRFLAGFGKIHMAFSSIYALFVPHNVILHFPDEYLGPHAISDIWGDGGALWGADIPPARNFK